MLSGVEREKSFIILGPKLCVSGVNPAGYEIVSQHKLNGTSLHRAFHVDQPL